MDIFTIDKEYADRLYALLESELSAGNSSSLAMLDKIKSKLKEHKAVTLDDLSRIYMLVTALIELHIEDHTPTICPGCGRIQTLKQQGLDDLEDYFATVYGEAYKKYIGFVPDGTCGE